MVFLDHNRRALLGTAYEEMLACIRCGACLNVCPVYRKVSGHAYDSVYSGPMGKILTPLLTRGEEGRDLPGASSLCGACTEACPVEIPLADLLVRLRADLRVPGPLRPLPRPGRHPGAGRRTTGCRARGTAWPAGRAPLASRAAPRTAKHCVFDAGRGRGRRRPATGSAPRRPDSRRSPARGGRAGSRWSPAGPRPRDLPLPDRRSFRARWAARPRATRSGDR